MAAAFMHPQALSKVRCQCVRSEVAIRGQMSVCDVRLLSEVMSEYEGRGYRVRCQFEWSEVAIRGQLSVCEVRGCYQWLEFSM